MFTSAGPWNPVRSEKCWENSLIPWQRSVWVHKSLPGARLIFVLVPKPSKQQRCYHTVRSWRGPFFCWQFWSDVCTIALRYFFLLHFLASFSVCSFCLRYECVLLGYVLNVDFHASTDAEVSSEELQDIESLITHLQHQHTLLGAVTQVSAHRHASVISDSLITYLQLQHTLVGAVMQVSAHRHASVT